MHRQFKPNPELIPLTCAGCGKTPHNYTAPGGVFIECSPCGRKTGLLETEELANMAWHEGQFFAIGRAA
jgi:hypothetical protein